MMAAACWSKAALGLGACILWEARGCSSIILLLLLLLPLSDEGYRQCGMIVSGGVCHREPVPPGELSIPYTRNPSGMRGSSGRDLPAEQSSERMAPQPHTAVTVPEGHKLAKMHACNATFKKCSIRYWMPGVVVVGGEPLLLHAGEYRAPLSANDRAWGPMMADGSFE